MAEFKVGDRVRHRSGRIGTAQSIDEHGVYVLLVNDRHRYYAKCMHSWDRKGDEMSESEEARLREHWENLGPTLPPDRELACQLARIGDLLEKLLAVYERGHQ